MIIRLSMVCSLVALGTFYQCGFACDDDLVSDVVGATTERKGPESLRQSKSFPRKLGSDHVPNLIQLHERIYCGGMPRGDIDFAALAQRGIKVIVSVDGVVPDVELARSHSIRYVHLPSGYGTISARRGLEFAKAIRQFNGPILFHCHHGKHRAPVAAVIGGLKAGLIDRASADATLQMAGTDRKYRGLFAAVESAREVDSKELGELQVDFKSVSPVADLASTMVSMQSTRDELWDAFRGVEKVRTSTKKANSRSRISSDLSSHALLLKEHYAELIRQDVQQDFGRDFTTLLSDSHQHVSAFSFQVRDAANEHDVTNDLRCLKQMLLKIDANCKACHDRFRGR